MGWLSNLFGGPDDDVEYTVADDGTDHTIVDGDLVDGAEVYIVGDEDADEYDESNSGGFDPYYE